MTLNEVIHKILKPLAEGSLFINDFGFGDIDQIGASGPVKYPLMWVLTNPVTYAGNSFEYSVSIIFASKVNDNASDELDVQSDMISVGADIAAGLVFHEDFNVSVDRNFTFKPFRERFTDLVAGVVMDAVIKIDAPLNDCKAAFKKNLL